MSSSWQSRMPIPRLPGTPPSTTRCVRLLPTATDQRSKVKFLQDLFDLYADAATEAAQYDPLRPGASDRI